MRRRLTFIVATVAAVTVLAFGGVAIAGATRGDDEEQPLSGQVAEQAKDAALKAAGGGSIVEMERDLEDGRTYKVEVKKAGGVVVDVDLDSAFKVVASESERDEANEQDDQDDKNEANEQDDQDDKGDDDKNEQADQDD